MSKLAYVVPPEEPGGTRQITIEVPDSALWCAILVGAVYLLTLPRSWEEVEDYSYTDAETAAGIFNDVFESLIEEL